MQDEILKNLYLYEGHWVQVKLSDEAVITDRLLRYDDKGIYLGETGKYYEFDVIDDLFYYGFITSYYEDTGIGIIDQTYSFHNQDCQNKDELIQYSEKQYEYKVLCRLTSSDDFDFDIMTCDYTDRLIQGNMVQVVKNAKNILDSAVLTKDTLLYLLSNGERKIGTLSKDVSGYKLICNTSEVLPLNHEDITDIIRVPKINELIIITTSNGCYKGYVAAGDNEYFTIINSDKEIVRLSWNDVNRISYYGEIKVEQEGRTSVKKYIDKASFRRNDNFVVQKNLNKQYWSQLVNGLKVSFSLGVYKDEICVRNMELLSAPETDKPCAASAIVMVRRVEMTEEQPGSIKGFWVVTKDDYDANRIEENKEFFVPAQPLAKQFKELIKKIKSADSFKYDYTAVVDIYFDAQNNETYGILCEDIPEELIGEISKKYDKKYLAWNWSYDQKKDFGILTPYGKRKGKGKEGCVFKCSYAEVRIHGEKRKTLDSDDVRKYQWAVYTLDYGRILKGNQHPAKTITFFERPEEDTEDSEGKVEYYESESRITFADLRNRLTELYSEVSDTIAKEYSFGLMYKYETDKEITVLHDTYINNGGKQNDNKVNIITHYIKTNDVIDTSNTIYIVAYVEGNTVDGVKNAEEDTFCYVISKYVNLLKKLRNLKKIKVLSDSIEITEKLARISQEELNQQLQAFEEEMKPYEAEITDTVPELVSGENFLTEDQNGFKLNYKTKDNSGEGIIWRFGVLTEIDPKEEYAYINHRLRVPVDVLESRTLNNFVTNGYRSMLIAFRCNDDGSINKVQFPTKEMAADVEYQTGYVEKSYNPDDENKKEKSATIYIRNKNVRAKYFISSIGDGYIHNLAATKASNNENKSELVNKGVFIKSVTGCKLNISGKDNILPRYVLSINCQYENLRVEKGIENDSFIAVRDALTFFEIKGRAEVIKEHLDKTEGFYLDIDENSGNLVAVLKAHKVQEELINPYSYYAADGRPIDDSEDYKKAHNQKNMFFKREEEADIWKVIAHSEGELLKEGKTVILYGQKRCGKSSLEKEIVRKIKKENDRKKDDIPSICIEYGKIIDNYKINQNSDVEAIEQELYRDLLRKILDKPEAGMEINNIHREVLQTMKVDEYRNYNWEDVFRNAVITLKNPLLVVMDEFTDVCANILEKYQGDWTKKELAKRELNFLNVLESVGATQLIIGHENMKNVFDKMGLTNSMLAKSKIIPLAAFSPNSAEELIRIPVERELGFNPYTKQAVELMKELSGCSPYVLMRLCNQMFIHLTKEYEHYVIDRQAFDADDVYAVMQEWLEELKRQNDGVKELFDTILNEAGDDWFFKDNPVYTSLCVNETGIKARRQREKKRPLIERYLESAAIFMVNNNGVCEQLQLRKKLSDELYTEFTDKLNSGRIKPDNELTQVDIQRYIEDMINEVEEKLKNRKVISIRNHEVHIVMGLYVEYVKSVIHK